MTAMSHHYLTYNITYCTYITNGATSVILTPLAPTLSCSILQWHFQLEHGKYGFDSPTMVWVTCVVLARGGFLKW